MISGVALRDVKHLQEKGFFDYPADADDKEEELQDAGRMSSPDCVNALSDISNKTDVAAMECVENTSASPVFGTDGSVSSTQEDVDAVQESSDEENQDGKSQDVDDDNDDDDDDDDGDNDDDDDKPDASSPYLSAVEPRTLHFSPRSGLYCLCEPGRTDGKVRILHNNQVEYEENFHDSEEIKKVTEQTYQELLNNGDVIEETLEDGALMVGLLVVF